MGTLIKQKKHKEIYRETTAINKLLNSLQHLDDLSGNEFEDFLCDVFFLAKYKVKKNAKLDKGDGGIDIIISKLNSKIAIQAKAYEFGNKEIGVDTVRDLLGSITSEHIKHGVVITTTCFTGEAINFAQENKNIELIDRENLYTLIEKLHPSLMSKLYYEEFLHKNNIQKCEKCNGILFKKYNKKTKKYFLACTNFPNCKYTKNYAITE